MRAGYDVYVLTPGRWNPHTDAYARNEDNIVDWEGNVKEVKDRIMTLDLNQVNCWMMAMMTRHRCRHLNNPRQHLT